MSARGQRILYVCGFPSSFRAKDLAAPFERFGKLVRADIPVARHYNSSPYGFIEYREAADAEIAWKEMHHVRLNGATLTVEWARRAPSNNWRIEELPDDRSATESRGHSHRASWDRDDHRGSRDYDNRLDERAIHRDYPTERGVPYRPSRDYLSERTDESRYSRDEDPRRAEDHRRDVRDYERAYEQRRDREDQRSRDRDHDYARAQTYPRDYEEDRKRQYNYERVSDRDELEHRRQESERRRSRSPRRDSGYVDSTAVREARDRQSSSYGSQEYREPDRDRRSNQDDSSSRHSRQYEREYRDEEQQEKKRSPVKTNTMDWGPDSVEADGARTPLSPSAQHGGPSRGSW